MGLLMDLQRPPIAKGRQNQLRFLKMDQKWAAVTTAKSRTKMEEATKDGR